MCLYGKVVDCQVNRCVCIIDGEQYDIIISWIRLCGYKYGGKELLCSIMGKFLFVVVFQIGLIGYGLCIVQLLIECVYVFGFVCVLEFD